MRQLPLKTSSKTASGRLLLAAALGAALAVPLAAGGAQAQEPAAHSPPRTLTVSASGQTSAFPDMATIEAGVTTEAKNAADALTRNSTVMKDMMEALGQAGVESKDIATSNFSVEPRYPSNNDAPAKIIGYTVSNSVSVRVRNLAALGRTLDKLVSSGANQVSNIDFVVSKADEMMDEARKNAITTARRNAETYAAAAGAELGAVISISESGGGGSHYRMKGRNNSALISQENSVPVAAGQQSLGLEVSVTWALK